MVALVSVAVFAAVSLAVLSLLWWHEERKSSPAARLRAVVGTAGAPGRLRSVLRDRLLGGPDAEAAPVDRTAGAGLALCRAGYRDPAALRVYRAASLVAPPSFALAAFAAGMAAGMPDRAIAVMAAASFAAGLFLPGAVLKGKARRRQETIVDTLPDALDLLTVCVEAGLGLNAAFVRLSDEFRLTSPPLSEEFDFVNREMVAGRPRVDALRGLADRTGVEDVKSLVAMLVQTEKLGTGLAQSLRVHSDTLRTKRRQRAEEAAAKTTIKLIFPLVFLLFPSLFIVILGPGALQVVRILLPAAGGQGG